MKQCTYCGKQYSDEASICSVDQQPLKDLSPSPPPFSPASASLPLPASDKQQVIDSEHIKLLAIFHFVVAGLALAGIGFVLLHYLIFSTVVSNPDLWKNTKNPSPFPVQEFFKIFIWFYLFAAFLLATAAILNLLSGLFLRQRRHRTFSIIVAALDCLQIPFGTTLGVFTIIVLCRKSVCDSYAG